MLEDWICNAQRAVRGQLDGKDAYPLLKIDESLDVLGGAQYFLAIDLASACNQVEVHPDDQYKTTFITPHGPVRVQSDAIRIV